MRITAMPMFLAVWALIGQPSMADSQSSMVQPSRGARDILPPLSNHNAIYSDGRGNSGGTHRKSDISLPPFSSPHGALPASVTPFGTPTPPNLLTPAPLLPLHPRGMATPRSQAPASSGGPNGYGAISGRPGR